MPTTGSKILPAEAWASTRAVVAWSGATIHGSEANQTGRWRRAYAVHFVKPGFSMQEGVPTPDLSKLNDAQAGGNAGADSAFHSRL